MLALVALLSTPMLTVLYGQNAALYYNKVEHLRLGERISLRTNLVDWAVVVPNLGVEMTLGNKSWNKWTIGLSGRLNWQSGTKSLSYNVFDLYDGRVELRKYWHGKNPRRVFYWGVYGGANHFDIKLSETGKKGSSFFGGLTIGTTTQLYGYQNGSSLDLDLGLNVGVVLAKYDEYRREIQDNQYVYTTVAKKESYRPTFSPLVYAMSTDVVKVSLVYHFGTKVANRYKKRELVDEEYRLRIANEAYRRDTLRAAKEEAKAAKRIERARNKKLKEYEKAEKAKQKAAQKAALKAAKAEEKKGEKK